MSGGPTLLALGVALVVLVAGVRASLHLRAALVAALFALGLASGALWWLTLFAARLPAPATPIRGGGEVLVSRVLTFGAERALVRAEEGLQWIELPSGELGPFLPYPAGAWLYVSGAVERAGSAALILHESGPPPHRECLVLAGPEALVIAPGAICQRSSDESLALALDPEGSGFLLVRTTPEGIHVWQLGLGGALAPHPGWPAIAQVRGLIGHEACVHAGSLYVGGNGEMCRVEGATCPPLEDADGLVCPGSLRTHPTPSRLLLRDAVEELVQPISADPYNEVYSYFPAEGSPELLRVWITPDFHLGFVHGERELYVDYLTEEETPLHGHLGGEAVFVAQDLEGQVVGEAHIARWSFPRVYFLPWRAPGGREGREPDQTVVVDASLGEEVRLGSHLERLDPPTLPESVRSRLAPWGGRSRLFELWLALALVASLGIWPLLPLLRGERVTRQRALVVSLALVLPPLAELLVRLFRL